MSTEGPFLRRRLVCEILTVVAALFAAPAAQGGYPDCTFFCGYPCPPCCVPDSSCYAQGRQCGSAWTGCDYEFCGNCPSGQVCTVAGQCCTPTSSCAAQGRQCGYADTGCGQEFCGNCPSGQTCGADGHCSGGPANCNCYWASDCPSGQSCNYASGCGRAPKGTPGYCPNHGDTGQCDGTCTGAGAVWDLPIENVARAVDLYFQAYEKTAKTGKSGYPDPALIARAEEVQLSSGFQQDILRQIYNALDLTLGYDFTQPQMTNTSGQARFGFIRFVPDKDATMALLKGVHQGVVDAINQGNPSAVVPPLVAFWDKYPDYKPAHVGRCYPHGHQYPDNALQCQTDELTRMLAVWFSNRPKSGKK